MVPLPIESPQAAYDGAMPEGASPRLTFAIPTWNRAQDLERCVHSIAPQAAQHSGRVEILIADNASTDATSEVIRDLQARYPFVRQVRNPTNIGPDHNYLVLFEHAGGDYVWLFGDDDYLADGALQTVLREIDEQAPDLLLTNYRFCNVERRPDAYQPPAHSRFHENLRHLDLDALFSLRGHWISQISCEVFRRACVNVDDLRQHADRYRNWLQVYAVASAASVASRPGNVSALSLDAVWVRTDNSRTPLRVFYNVMPAAFTAILREVGARADTIRRVKDEIRRFALPLRVYVLLRMRGAPDLPDVPLRYKLVNAVGGRFVILLWKLYRYLKGRGYTLPPLSI